ncbi:AAA family ATPase [Hymenobacter sp. ASUV-10]|uniref:AAA family ATPase n=1 Tax=Hymenobacter aranciens TaxID=3063996 RepID=A0ABT9BHH3_9BACT|nr:AAA family ATPase [Hymenobacter sp. ASUV-10]MDO7877712.1 AAA family ATPase [Hymenobacter sp. ASUV-10]
MLIEEIRVQGYKSLVDATLHVRPLTLLAGTNSSGKSSIMQPLLLIKQTMEANYNPAGALVLNGAHVQADTAGDLMAAIGKSKAKQLLIGITGSYNRGETSVKRSFELAYHVDGANFLVSYQQSQSMGWPDGPRKTLITPDSTWDSMHSQLDPKRQKQYSLKNNFGHVQMRNGFLVNSVSDKEGNLVVVFKTTIQIDKVLSTLLHIPGLRNKAERTYLPTLFQDSVKGTFDLYVAGIIVQWQQQENTKELYKLNDYLYRLGLTDSITAKVKNANDVELSVSRLPAGSRGKPRKADMVNIADVGIGVSQVLPIVVALIAAQEGQLVYVEQPELHLHPRAQVVMAELLAEAANRGVRVIVETHSSLLLLTVQTMVAEGEMKPEDVGLHWFSRDAKGATTVRFEQPDENGAYGDWPEDFGDVELEAKRRYLDAIGQRRAQRQAGKATA